MPLLIVALGIASLLVLIMYFRINAFIALICVALGIGVAIGMQVMEVVTTIEKGIGDTLGSLALILGFGAMLGSLVAESGAVQSITDKLIAVFGVRRVQWAMVLTGFIVGLPLFYTVAFLMVIPIIFAVAASTRLPLLYVGVPMIASLSVTHGFLPPHPAPAAIVEFYGADIHLTLLYGLILAIPAVVLAGPLFASTLKNIDAAPPKGLYKLDVAEDQPRPAFWVAVLTALIPVLLMALAAVAKMLLPHEGELFLAFQFLGHPMVALLLALLVAVYTLGVRMGRTVRQVMESMTESVGAIAMIMLIIAGGGALKQVLVDSGTSDYIVGLMKGTAVPPLVMAWSIAAALRIALGSATVAALTAAGIVAPMVATTGVNAELLVLATGAGSLTCSQVNDTGFWLFKEYFNLSIGQTLRSWTLMETIVSLVGLAGCLVLDIFI
ncbi:MAG: gluconate permease [Saprospiraceae bacterium]|nr:MAG: gluconate permease [Saprospiraceae bacterium]